VGVAVGEVGQDAGYFINRRSPEYTSLLQKAAVHNLARRLLMNSPRKVKILSPTAIATADGACGSSAIGPFRRLTARLPGPKLCVSPQPHRVCHELRPPALATAARHPGSGPPPGRRIAPSLRPRRISSFSSLTRRVVAPVIGSVRAAK